MPHIYLKWQSFKKNIRNFLSLSKAMSLGSETARVGLSAVARWTTAQAHHPSAPQSFAT